MTKMKLHIYIFRHGQTFFNRDKKFTGWKESILTPLGIKQAKKVGKMLKDKKFDIAFHSGMKRSISTLKYVLSFQKNKKNIKIISDPRIKERSYGKLAGLNHEAIIKKYGEKQYKIWHRGYDTPPPNGESIKMVEKRVNPFIKDLINLMKKKKVNVAISAHGNSIRPMRKYFEKLSVKQMMKLENPWDDYFEYTINV